MNKPFRKIKLLFEALGPGVTTGAADDDPSGIGTYTVAGAQLGTGMLWTAFLTWPLMAAVQMACARIGMVTGEGLAAAFQKKFPRPLLLIVCAALFIANTLNVGADISAMADCAEILGAGSSHIYVILIAMTSALATIYLRYFQIARTLKWLALFLFSYIIVVFIVGPEWRSVFQDTFIPHLPQGTNQWSILVAILGTTISPYLFFWQASQEVEEEKASGRDTLQSRVGVTDRELLLRRFDVGVGTFFSNLVMYFVILASALTLNRHGLANIETTSQAASALAPIAGHFAALLYSIGVIGVGFLAIPTLTGSAAYAMAETFGWDEGLDAKFGKAKAFYSVIAVSTLFAAILDFADINPIKALFWSAVLNGVLAPFLLLGILLVIRDPKIMYGQRSSKLTQACVTITMIMMFLAALGMFIF